VKKEKEKKPEEKKETPASDKNKMIEKIKEEQKEKMLQKEKEKQKAEEDKKLNPQPPIDSIDPEKTKMPDLSKMKGYIVDVSSSNGLYKYDFNGKTYILKLEKEDSENYFTIWLRENNKNQPVGKSPRSMSISNLIEHKTESSIAFKTICKTIEFDSDGEPRFIYAYDFSGHVIRIPFIKYNSTEKAPIEIMESTLFKCE